MTNIYPTTLKTITHLMDVLDEGREELEDAGIALEYINVLSDDGERLIGQIEFDCDRHPFFSPEEEDPDLEF